MNAYVWCVCMGAWLCVHVCGVCVCEKENLPGEEGLELRRLKALCFDLECRGGVWRTGRQQEL